MGLFSKKDEDDEVDGLSIDLDLDGPDPELDPVSDDAEGEENECLPLDEAKEQIGFELYDWDADRLDRLDDAVHELGLPHEWESEGFELVVHAEDEAAIDALIAQLANPNELAPMEDDGDGDDGADALGELFVAADRLKKPGFDVEGVKALLRGAEAMTAEPPFGVDEQVWAGIGARVDHLLQLVDDRDDQDATIDVASQLREILRPIV